MLENTDLWVGPKSDERNRENSDEQTEDCTLIMETEIYSETSVRLYRTIGSKIPEADVL